MKILLLLIALVSLAHAEQTRLDEVTLEKVMGLWSGEYTSSILYGYDSNGNKAAICTLNVDKDCLAILPDNKVQYIIGNSSISYTNTMVDKKIDTLKEAKNEFSECKGSVYPYSVTLSVDSTSVSDYNAETGALEFTVKNANGSTNDQCINIIFYTEDKKVKANVTNVVQYSGKIRDIYTNTADFFCSDNPPNCVIKIGENMDYAIEYTDTYTITCTNGACLGLTLNETIKTDESKEKSDKKDESGAGHLIPGVILILLPALFALF